MVEILSILADSIYFFFVAFESGLDMLDGVMVFDLTALDWVYIVMIFNWLITFIFDLLHIDLDKKMADLDRIESND
jgi:hypothetical protein